MKCEHCQHCQCETDDGSKPSAEELDAQMNPSEYPFGVTVSPARRAYLDRMYPGDGPD